MMPHIGMCLLSSLNFVLSKKSRTKLTNVYLAKTVQQHCLVFCQPSTYVLSAHPFLSNNVYVMYKGF